jgi:chromosome segregation ATPase
MATENNGQSSFRRLLGVLWRVALVLVIGIALGVGVYIGVPLAYRGLVEPSQVNTDRIEFVTNEVELNRTEIEDLRESTGERLAAFEAGEAQRTEDTAELQAALEVLRGEIDDLSAELNAADAQLELLTSAVSDMEEQLEQAAERADNTEILRELTISRAMTYLVRARLWLLENNIGLAQDELQRARDLLVEADAAGEIERIQAAITRLDQAWEELNTTPLVAADDLEIAWKLLVGAEIEAEPEEAEQ